jgi:hypothetical protein
MTRIEKALEIFNKGFNTKTDQKRCLELVSRQYEEDRHVITNGLLDLRNTNQMKEDADFEALYYGMPLDLHQYRPKHSATYKALFPMAVERIEYLVSLRNQIKDAPIVPVESVSKAKVLAKQIESLSMTNKIELAVMPLKTAAIERAEKEAKELVVRYVINLANVGYDLSKVAPYPKSTMSRNDYAIAMARRSTYHMITKVVSGSRRMNEPEIVEVIPEYVVKFIETTKKDAAEQYDAFVAKLIIKIGDVNEATLVGDHVWSYSILTVTKAFGNTEKWKTQMIVNISKLGKLFNQWPTRKVK